MKLASCLAFATILLFSPFTNAKLITQDLISAGDSLATYDDNTGNLWIKSIVTQGMSYNEIQELLDSTYLYSGFSMATVSDVLSVVDDYDLYNGFDGFLTFIDALIKPTGPIDKTQHVYIQALGFALDDDPVWAAQHGWNRTFGGRLGCEGSGGRCNSDFVHRGDWDFSSTNLDFSASFAGVFFKESRQCS